MSSPDGPLVNRKVRPRTSVYNGAPGPIGVAGVVLPFVRLARSAVEDLDPHVARIPDEQPAVGGARAMASARPNSPGPSPSLPRVANVGAVSVEDPDLVRLRVEDVDIAVAVHRQRSDPAEEILARPVHLTDGDFRDERGLGGPYASREGAYDGGCRRLYRSRRAGRRAGGRIRRRRSWNEGRSGKQSKAGPAWFAPFLVSVAGRPGAVHWTRPDPDRLSGSAPVRRYGSTRGVTTRINTGSPAVRRADPSTTRCPSRIVTEASRSGSRSDLVMAPTIRVVWSVRVTLARTDPR